MAHIKPFKALRPSDNSNAELIAALPYDVYSSEDARAEVMRNPYSFLGIDRAETLLPEGTDPYSDQVYAKALEQLTRLTEEGRLVSDSEACYYLYALTMNGRTQTGLVACTAVDDYLNHICREHENTVIRKEQDRIRHVKSLSAHTGPIFLSYHADPLINRYFQEIVDRTAPIYDFTANDGVRHTVWLINDAKTVAHITELFDSQVANTYIADGHHRAAAAVKNALERRGAEALPPEKRDQDMGEAGVHKIKADAIGEAGVLKIKADAMGEAGVHEYDYFLSVLFPSDQLYIMDYNRVILDLNGLTKLEILYKLSDKFELRRIYRLRKGMPVERPAHKGSFHVYLGGCWYLMTIRQELADLIKDDVIKSLDVSVIQDYVLDELFGIKDPRTDKRVAFVGGIKGIAPLKELADKSGGMAISMYPTSIDELMDAADEGRLMPPKSTWFEPKLRSGLLMHTF